MKSRMFTGLMALVIIFTLIAGCTGGSTATPTVDSKQVLTAVVETVNAQITNAAKLTPKPTSTPQPTETRSPTATLGGTTAGTQPAGTKAAGTPASGTQTTPQATLPVLPTATTSGGGVVPTVPDKMTYISQSIPDGSIFSPSQGFKFTWVIKNSGTTEWTEKYWIRLYGGERYSLADFQIGQHVKPGATIEIIVDMHAPATSGKYNSWWVISTPELVNFGSFNFSLVVK